MIRHRAYRPVLATALAALLAAPAGAEDVVSAPAGILRGIDKVSGEVVEMEVATGQAHRFGRLDVTLTDCRYPVEDPSSNAYAHLVIADTTRKAEIFSGWMIASSPALSSLDDARYDVWLIRCKSE